MADFGTPATANYTPPDGLATLSGLMSLKQKQQGLQQQQLEMAGQRSRNQSLASAAENDTAVMGERQRISAMMASGKDDQGNAINGADGQPDPSKVLPALGRLAPRTGQAYAQSILDTERNKVGLQAASQSLDAQGRAMLMGPVQAAVGNPKATAADVNAGIDNLVSQHPEMANAANYLKGLTKHIDQIGPDPAKRTAAFNALAATMQGGQQVNTQPQAGTVNTGAVQSQGAFAPAVVGGGFTPSTQVRNQLTPGETLPQAVVTPAGVVNRSPISGALSAPPTGANLNPSQAQAAAQRGQAEGVTARVQSAQAQANNTAQTQDALGRAMRILESGNAANTGVGFEARRTVKNFLAGVGFDTGAADDTNSLVKNLARYEASRATASGLGGTDAARELAHNGSPNTAVDDKALTGIVKQSLATEKAIAAYANTQSKTTDPEALAKNERDFRSIPNVIHGYEYAMSRSPQEADEYLRKHGISKEQMKATRDQIKEFESR